MVNKFCVTGWFILLEQVTYTASAAVYFSVANITKYKYKVNIYIWFSEVVETKSQIGPT